MIWVGSALIRSIKALQSSKPVRRISKRWRKLVETVASHLTQRYQIVHTRVRDLWRYQNRLTRKVLSHTICVFMDPQLGRPPLHLDDLVSNQKGCGPDLGATRVAGFGIQCSFPETARNSPPF